MKLASSSFTNNQRIPADYSFCAPDPAHHVCLGRNLNPQLAWSEVPAGTQSFVVICHDPDVPSRGDDVNQEGRTVPASLPRVDFFHWVLVDLPSTLDTIAEGEFSHQVTPRGKPGPQAPHGARQGINNYPDWFANDHDMKGDYYGYDGPCPQWNDERMHHYHFRLYALDVPLLGLSGRFSAADALARMDGHVLATAQHTGRYSLNRNVRK